MMVYLFGLLFIFIFILLFYLARLLFAKLNPPKQGYAPHHTLSSTASLVFAHLGPLVPDNRPTTPEGHLSSDGLYWTIPHPQARLGRGVTRAHPDAESDPELPSYTAEPTSSQLILGLEPPPAAYVTNEHRADLSRSGSQSSASGREGGSFRYSFSSPPDLPLSPTVSTAPLLDTAGPPPYPGSEGESTQEDTPPRPPPSSPRKLVLSIGKLFRPPPAGYYVSPV